MLLGSFYTGLSGLQANASALNVIGNNLANVNTIGFKRSQANFAQIMANTVRGVSGAGNPIQIGLGVGQSEIVAKFEQGSIQNTGISTNLSIQGEGFFQVKNNGNSAYTRAGNFGFDENGYLVAAGGGRVQGWLGTDATTGGVDISGGIEDLRIDLGQSSEPKVTSLVKFITNLSGTASGTNVPPDSYSTVIEVYDSKGISHQLSVTFTKDAATANQWNYSFQVDGEINGIELTNGAGQVTTSTAETPVSGEILFGDNGEILSIDGNPLDTGDPPTGTQATNPIIEVTLTNGAAPLNITWQAANINTTTPSESTSNVTNFGSNYNTGTLTQDGYGSGVLQDVTFDQDGTMIGFFDNGLSLELGRVAIATFNNKLGLKQVDGGYYLSTAASGPASNDGEGTGGRGSIIGGSLESSNVDVAEEFTSMIINQRGYQSNSKTITTADQLLQEAINLKR